MYFLQENVGIKVILFSFEIGPEKCITGGYFLIKANVAWCSKGLKTV